MEKAPKYSRAFAGSFRAPSSRSAPLLAAAFCALAAACAGNNLAPTFTIFRNAPPTRTQLSQEIVLIADSHAHHLYGKPTPIQTNFADWFSASAIRPPQADLWGWRFLRWTLGMIPPDRPIIHLGDVDDISCAAEFATFEAEMTRAQGRKRWVLVPGNHDGFFYGNYDGRTVPPSFWSQACAGSAPLDKAGVVAAYLEALKREGSVPDPDAGLGKFAAQFSGQDEGSFQYRRRENEWVFFQRAAWKIHHNERWRSWIAQEVDLSWSEIEGAKPVRRVYAILLDSAAYSQRPELIPLNKIPIAGTAFAPNAGLNGEIPSEELATISEWLADARRENAIVLMMAHHPLSALGECSRKALGKLRAKYGDQMILYASAHDHSGKWLVNSAGAEQWLELNVGSLLDAPMEYRRLQLIGSATGPARIGVDSPLVRLYARWQELTPKAAPHCDLHVDWEPVKMAFPLGYKVAGIADIKKIEDEILRVLLASLKQEVEKIPSLDPTAPWRDPAGGGPQFDGDAAVVTAIDAALASGDQASKMALVLALASRVSGRFPEGSEGDVNTRDFEMCQVMWATKYERAGERKPDVDDTTVFLPPEEP